MSESRHDEGGRDPTLAAIYHAAPDDAPSPALDAAIRAAARREVSARPRPAGFRFVRSWPGALSVAAVLVLSASLVILMREEAPDVVSPQGSDVGTMAGSNLESPALEKNSGGTANSQPYELNTQPSKNLGLKPSGARPPSGLDTRQAPFREPTPRASADAAPASRGELQANGPVTLAKRRDAFGDRDESSRSDTTSAEQKLQAQAPQRNARNEIAQAPASRAAEPPAEKEASVSSAVTRNAAKTESVAMPGATDGQRDVQSVRGQVKDSRERSSADTLAATPSGMAAPAPAARPPIASAPPLPADNPERAVDVAPEKWLARIEELRSQGRLDEARASLLEFKRRYPDYRLPDSLRNGIR